MPWTVCMHACDMRMSCMAPLAHGEDSQPNLDSHTSLLHIRLYYRTPTIAASRPSHACAGRSAAGGLQGLQHLITCAVHRALVNKSTPLENPQA